MFIGRAEEQRVISRFLHEKGYSGLVLFGRRRIGKTELIKKAVDDFEQQSETPVKFLYYECKDAAGSYNLDRLTRSLRILFQQSHIFFECLEDLLSWVFEQAQTEPLILVLDEYPYLRKNTAGADSILQSVIDEWKSRTQVKLILSGSYIDIMRSLLAEQNPLHGRLPYQIHLKAMDYYDAGKFHPSFSPEDRIKLYSVLGGVPYYNSLVHPEESVEENLIHIIASEHAQLGSEIPLLLHSEIIKTANANVVFDTLAAGVSRFKDIESKTHLDPRSLSNILKKLVDMDLIEKEAPVNDPENPKKTRYKIKDRLSLFYYRYIFPNSSEMCTHSGQLFYQFFIQEDFESQFVPHCFERICREYLIRANNAGKINPPFLEIGSYYHDDPVHHKNGEFDNVTRDRLGYIAYESKFRNSPVNQHMISEEIEQVNASGLMCRKYGFFSRSGFETDGENDSLILIELSSLYEDGL